MVTNVSRIKAQPEVSGRAGTSLFTAPSRVLINQLRLFLPLINVYLNPVWG